MEATDAPVMTSPAWADADLAGVGLSLPEPSPQAPSRSVMAMLRLAMPLFIICPVPFVVGLVAPRSAASIGSVALATGGHEDITVVGHRLIVIALPSGVGVIRVACAEVVQGIPVLEEGM